MTKVFIGGSRRVSKLDDIVMTRLERIVDKALPVIVGDASGADRAVQAYFASRGYANVEVFCAQGLCRNNLGAWPMRSIGASSRRKDFQFFAAKDRAMAIEASHGLMLWDGESAGTAMNVYRLTQAEKMVAVYVEPRHTFDDLRTAADWPAFLACCSVALRRKLEREIETERKHEDDGPRQLALGVAVGK